ncbi:MAG TPA: putative quinol monooxygenase [Gemmatimonadales bacterium]|nr:putative quinol monooxygenase [Gemmatimonadales bacterium]
MPAAPVTVMIIYHAQPGRGAAAGTALAALIATVQEREPDCHGIALLQDVADDTRFLLYERWASQAAYTGPHMRTPHIQAFIRGATDLFTGPPEITFWREPSGR